VFNDETRHWARNIESVNRKIDHSHVLEDQLCLMYFKACNSFGNLSPNTTYDVELYSISPWSLKMYAWKCFRIFMLFYVLIFMFLCFYFYFFFSHCRIFVINVYESTYYDKIECDVSYLLNVPEFLALVSSQKVNVTSPVALCKCVSDIAHMLDAFLDVSREIQSHTVQFTLVVHFIGVVKSSFVHC